MVRIFKLPSWAVVFFIFVFLALVALSLPVFLMVGGSLVTFSIVRNLLSSKKKASEIIHNQRIGAYRVKTDENDPNVIEVIESNK
jgi:Na+/proline symporter